jgi:hypothetical protein
VRVLIFHGYLLEGTGSNVYNANLAAALVGLGHEVHMLCQDRAADELPFVDAVGDWDAGQLAVRTLREPVRCTVYRPALAGSRPTSRRTSARCATSSRVPSPTSHSRTTS